MSENSELNEKMTEIDETAIEAADQAEAVEAAVETENVETEAADSKCVGNSTTLPRDAETSQEAKKILLSLSGQVAARLQKNGQLAGSRSYIE